MKTKIAIGLLCIASVLAWTGVAAAQTSPTIPKVQLPSGETVWDLSGDWDAFVENLGEWRQHYGMYPNVYRITQTGSTLTGIRVKNNPPPSMNRAGSPGVRGEVDKSGFKEVTLIDRGEPWPSKGQISEDGKKIVIEHPLTRVTLTRSGDRAPLVGMWRLMTFQREYQASGERESPMGSAPTGYILFLPEGRMAVVITGEGRKAPTTDEDRAGLFKSLVAYTGPYRVDGDKWITTVEVSANPAAVTTEQTRFFTIEGDRLQEMTAYAAQSDNRMARFVITYERMK